MDKPLPQDTQNVGGLEFPRPGSSATWKPVSVVVPTYNSGRFLAEAIGSILDQTVAPAEIIVIDDGSTDGTRAQLEPLMDRIVYCPQSNQGVAAARNHGIRLAQGDFVAFLDADDVWHPRKLEIQLRVFHERPDLGLLGTRAYSWPTKRIPEISAAIDGRLTQVTWTQLVVRNHLITSSVMVRSHVLKLAGEFDTDLQGPEDRDLWLRVAEHSDMMNIDLSLTGYRDVAGSVSKQASRCQQSMLHVLEKLDRRDIWRGRRFLRRKAYSYVYHSCAYLYSCDQDYHRVFLNMANSLVWYPLPYGSDESQTTWERPKRILVNLLRVLSLKPPSIFTNDSRQ